MKRNFPTQLLIQLPITKTKVNQVFLSTLTGIENKKTTEIQTKFGIFDRNRNLVVVKYMKMTEATFFWMKM